MKANFFKSGKVFYVLLLLILTLGQMQRSFANPQQEIIKNANTEYSNGYYDHALELYQMVLEQGYTSADLYYNIGNTFFKLNRIPEAVLYYERALKLAPNDENIRFNLELAQKRTFDKIESIPDLFYERWFRSLVNNNTADGWGIWSIVLLSVAFILAAIYLLSPRRGMRVFAFYFSATLIVLALSTLSMAYLQHHFRTANPEGIVFDPSVTVKSSPSDGSIDLFVIHEGTKVKIKDQVGDWYEVRIASGSQGWIKAGTIEKI